MMILLILKMFLWLLWTKNSETIEENVSSEECEENLRCFDEFVKANKKNLKEKTKKVGYTGKKIARKRIIKALIKISA